MRVATCNLLHGIDVRSRSVDLQAAASAIAALDADVVGLQEVDRGLARSGGVDQTAELAALLAMTGVFAPALLGDPDRRWTAVGADPGGPAYGVALLSRLPVAAHRVVALPGGGDGERAPRPPNPTRPPPPGWDHEPRTALVATVGDPALAVVVTHLSYLPWRGVRQLRAALRAAGPARHAVVLGDLNLPAWAVRAAAPPGWRPAGGGPTYPAWRPRLQVDHVLVRGPLHVRAVRLGPPGPSDHLPVVADLTL